MSNRGTLCHLSEVRRTHRRKRGGGLKRKLLITVILLLLISVLLNFRLSPILLELARAEIEKRTEHVLGDAIAKELEANHIPYRDIITLTYQSDGSVAAMQTDTAELLRLRTQLVKAALRMIDKEEEIPTKIPLASLLGINVLGGSPTFPVRMRLSQNVNAYFLSRFEAMGINQTRHSIVFRISIEVYVLIPSHAQSLTVVRDFPLTETLIVGAVPDAYTHINRLTDDITEGEIDDIYDFGASKN